MLGPDWTEKWFFDILKNDLTKEEIENLSADTLLPDEALTMSPFSSTSQNDPKRDEYTKLLKERTKKVFGSNENYIDLQRKVSEILTNRLNHELQEYPKLKEEYKDRPSLIPPPPLDNWNFVVGELIKDSKRFLSGMVQIWYWSDLVPRLKKRSGNFKTVIIVIIIIILVIALSN